MGCYRTKTGHWKSPWHTPPSHRCSRSRPILEPPRRTSMTPSCLTRQTLLVFSAVAVAALGVVIAPHAIADAECGPGEPPPDAASKDVSAIYGQPAQLVTTAH